MNLTNSQRAALQYIDEYALRTETLGQLELANVLAMSNISQDQLNEAQAQIRTYARIGVQFHPDRLDRNGFTVAEALLKSGIYKNQFETHLSNGGLDPYAGGRRARWEDRVFGEAFTANDAALSERPKYGALHLMGFPDGPCPRYGSCYFLTDPAVANRSTFTYMDSHRNPVEKGTLNTFKPIMAALLTECFERRFALGAQDISPPKLIQHLLTNLTLPMEDPSERTPARNLNHYIEAQVHGTLSLERDINYLVADPSFKGTKIEANFHQLCDKYDITLFWHCGFKLSVDKVPNDFRGPTMPSLAERIAVDNYVDPFVIGAATANLQLEPNLWADRGSYADVLQEFKLLWHVLVQYGGPAK